MNRKTISAKSVSIMAMSAAIYAALFFVSSAINISKFALLYLPIVLLGVFPLWFGWNGLIGSMIGAFIGGAFAEGLGPLGIFEAVVAFLIYMMNWVLMPRNAGEKGKKRNLAYLAGVYALTLFVGLAYIVWQYTILPVLFPTSEWAELAFISTFLINLPIVCIISPALIRAISPKLKAWGMYTGSFKEWLSRNRRNQS